MSQSCDSKNQFLKMMKYVTQFVVCCNIRIGGLRVNSDVFE